MTDQIDFANVTVAVLGDVMLDRFVYGDVSRISPEAPIPVLLKSDEAEMLGGAGNVARNIATLGGTPILIAVVGDDAAGHQISDGMGRGITSSVAVVPGHVTAVKTRFVSGQQQILRLDHERPTPMDADLTADICARLDKALETAQVLILSDYGKGLLTTQVIAHAIATARTRELPIVVDPKTDDLRIYAGATIVTPNAKETSLATGIAVTDDESATAAATQVVETSGIDGILLTRGPKGMSLMAPAQGHDGVLHIPTAARNVFDVSGAGDTVVATLALMLGYAAPLEDAARLANRAAGIAVGKRGTAAVGAQELFTQNERAFMSTVETDWSRVAATVQAWQAEGLRVGFTNGCFDLVHPGHVTLLDKARAQCDRLVVALNTDPSIARLKGPMRPVQEQASRLAVMSSIRSVDLVTAFGEDTPVELITAILPDIIFKGADYTVETVVGGDIVMANGGQVILIPLEDGHSTSRLVSRANS